MVDNSDDLIISVSADVAALRRSQVKMEAMIGAIAGNATKKFDAMGKSIEKSLTTSVQDRINQIVGVGTKASKEWTGVLARQGAEMESLRSKFNPIFASVNRYKASIVEIRQAHAMGAISAGEMTAAIGRERQAALSSIAALKQRNAALAATPKVSGGTNSFNTANIAAQLQDIGVTAAMGMSPLQIALQQGTQLSAVFQQLKNDGKSIGPSLASAFMSVVSPVSLVTIGVIAAGAAIYQYVAAGKKAKDLTQIFQQHADSIALVKQQYGDFGNYISSFKTEDAASQIRALKDQLAEFYSVVGKEASRKASFGAALLTELAPAFKDAPAAAKQMRNAFADLNASIRQGKPDLLSFRETMSKIANDPSVPQSIGYQAEAISKMKDEALKAARAIPGVNAALGLLGDIASEQVGKINAVKKALEELASIAVPALADSERAYRAYDLAVKNDGSMENRIQAARELQKALGRIKASEMPVPGEKPNRESMEPDKPTRTRSERTAERDANAYRDLVKSANDRIEQMQLEEQLIGKTGVAAEVYRLKLELIQKAQEKGRTIDPARRKELEALAETYGKLAERVAALSMAEELRYEREQMFRSPTEQRVADQLRGAGIDANSAQGQFLASQIRLNEKLAEGRDLAMDFASGFTNDLRNGVSEMEALANAAGRLGDKLLDMALNEAINGLFKNLFGGLLGGGGGGGLFGGLFGGGQKALAMGGGVGLYSGGGYTGPGGVNDPRGVVHAGEVVWSQRDVARAGGVGVVEAMRKGLSGYAGGGVVMPNFPTIQAPIMPSFPQMPSPGSESRDAVSANVNITIDATGADSAGLARVQNQLAVLKRDLPSRIIETVREARKSNVKF